MGQIHQFSAKVFEFRHKNYKISSKYQATNPKYQKELRISVKIPHFFNRMVQLSRRLLTNIWVRGAYDHPDSIKPFKVSSFWTNVMSCEGANIGFRKYLTIFLIFFLFDCFRRQMHWPMHVLSDLWAILDIKSQWCCGVLKPQSLSHLMPRNMIVQPKNTSNKCYIRIK